MSKLSIASYLAGKLSGSQQQQRKRFSSLLRLTIIGVALSVSIMLLSVAIILGFHRQIHEFAYSQTGHISLTGYGNNWRTSTNPVYVSPKMLSYLRQNPEVARVMPLIQQAGLLKTQDDFTGVLLYGIDSTFQSDYFSQSLRGVALPTAPLASGINPIVLPSHLAKRMGYSIGQKIPIYFFGDKIRIRSYQLVGIYESTGLELSPALCPLSSLQKLNHWRSDDYSRLLIMVKNPDESAQTLSDLIATLQERPDIIGEENYGLNLGRELQPELFSWLSFLDTNVYALLGLMILVGAFAMITGLIIVVLDKSKQIGILKALGASNLLLRRAFTMIALRLILRGLLWGNGLALLLCLVQKYGKVIRLNPANYFTDAVPIHLDLGFWIGINIGTLIIILLMILVPAGLVSRIHPAESMRID